MKEDFTARQEGEAGLLGDGVILTQPKGEVVAKCMGDSFAVPVIMVYQCASFRRNYKYYLIYISFYITLRSGIVSSIYAVIMILAL